jgi:hypothetical protein
VRGVHAGGWFDRREDFTVDGWYLHRKKPFGAAYDVEGDGHAFGECLGTMSSLVLSHELVPRDQNALVRTLLLRYGTSGCRETIYVPALKSLPTYNITRTQIVPSPTPHRTPRLRRDDRPTQRPKIATDQ